MEHKDVVEWLNTNRYGAIWRLSGDINTQDDLDNNLTWMEEVQAKPTLADLGL